MFFKYIVENQKGVPTIYEVRIFAASLMKSGLGSDQKISADTADIDERDPIDAVFPEAGFPSWSTFGKLELLWIHLLLAGWFEVGPVSGTEGL